MTRTGPHDNQKSCQEPAEFHYARATAVHEVIALLCFAADPVGDRGEDVGRDDEQCEVVLEQGGTEDDEEEAYREDLRARSVGDLEERMAVGRTKERIMIVLSPAMIAA